jgi:hypothetical protein
MQFFRHKKRFHPRPAQKSESQKSGWLYILVLEIFIRSKGWSFSKA